MQFSDATTAGDVAARILQLKGPTSVWKLHRLVYYSQCWHMVWENMALFRDRIEAWASGPVIPSIIVAETVDGLLVAKVEGDPGKLSEQERTTVDGVLGYYADMAPLQLSLLSRMEEPWKVARGDTPIGEPCDAEISRQTLRDYYSGLTGAGGQG